MVRTSRKHALEPGLFPYKETPVQAKAADAFVRSEEDLEQAKAAHKRAEAEFIKVLSNHPLHAVRHQGRVYRISKTQAKERITSKAVKPNEPD
jgi:hypothetical protein